LQSRGRVESCTLENYRAGQDWQTANLMTSMLLAF